MISWVFVIKNGPVNMGPILNGYGAECYLIPVIALLWNAWSETLHKHCFKHWMVVM